MEIISANQMYEADRKTIESGVAGLKLMENAGRLVAEIICENYDFSSVAVLCGAGNNGGDGFVAAHFLKKAGKNVDVFCVSDGDLKGDAEKAFNKYKIAAKNLNKADFSSYDVIVDAIFGIGLTRNLKSDVLKLIEKVNAVKAIKVAVDIASGLNANTGEIMGAAFKADLTISFSRKKFGHVLMPGKEYSGEVLVADIGIDEKYILEQKINYFENTIDLWREKINYPKFSDHKYSRGHTLVLGGGIEKTGAATLASYAALRAGSGVVTIAAEKNVLPVYAAKVNSIMLREVSTQKDFESILSDERINSYVIGPGAGVDNKTKAKVLMALQAGKNCVLDADALTVFQKKPEDLFDSINNNVVITPHEGEFARIFGSGGNKISRAEKAAKISGAVVVLKGSDTIIASPDGRVVINTNAPAYLATAGSGDVLSGIIAGLVASGTDMFSAACAGVWLHGQAANIAGCGMISEDLVYAVSDAVATLINS